MYKILVFLCMFGCIGCNSRLLNNHQSSPMPTLEDLQRDTLSGTVTQSDQSVSIALLLPNNTIKVYANGVLLDRYNYFVDPALQYIRFGHKVLRRPDGKITVYNDWAVAAGSTYEIKGFSK